MSTCTLETLCERHLHVLDSLQSAVYNIRIMHHEVWRDLNPVEGIIERRAGSRVEKQTRILPAGGKSDVDYMFQVNGVLVGECDTNELQLEATADSKAYCKVIASKDWINNLEETSTLRNIFSEAFVTEKSRLLVKPSRFKENVFAHCKFGMQRSPAHSKSRSPSVSGKGALNEYDVVPCLKLNGWPAVAEDWMSQGREGLYTLGPSLRQSIVKAVPILLVPTGNPLSPTAEDEWRLSFSFVEIEIFNNLIPKQRQLYGLLKYVFKELLDGIDLLSSYHIKTLMLWKVDEKPLDYWENIRPFQFLEEMFKDVFSATENAFIPHFFIANCNIFPVHKTNAEKKQQYLKVKDQLAILVKSSITKMLGHDLVLDSVDEHLEKACLKLKDMSKELHQGPYISGYLTRLLSVSWYCLQETNLRGTVQKSISQLRMLLGIYKDDKNIQRLLPMIEVIVSSMTEQCSGFGEADTALDEASSADKLSTLAHVSFIVYLDQKYERLQHYLTQMEPFLSMKDGIGVTVTKMETNVDFALDFLIAHMVDDLKCNRMYIEPRLIFIHLHVQLALRQSILSQKDGAEKLEVLMNRLIDIAVHQASDEVPYLGKLSYKHAGLILLRGYEEYFMYECEKQHGRTIIIRSNRDTESSLKTRDLATNFSLR